MEKFVTPGIQGFFEPLFVVSLTGERSADSSSLGINATFFRPSNSA
jgi:hypothetical protein